MVFVDVIKANKKVLCSGGAGTGKTFLALELARRWTYAGKKVAMPCGSKWLKRYLETRFAIPGLALTTVSSLELEAGRAGIDQFDAMIVDEGQNIFHQPDLKKLDCFLKGGLKDGQWCIFHDLNNQGDSVNKPDPGVLNFLETLDPALVPLNTNCRNTLNIINEVKNRLGADMGIKGAGRGPDVRQHEACSRKDAAKALAGELSHILASGHIPSSSITILSPRPFGQSVASLLPPELKEQICVLDEFAMRSFPPLKISFAQIHQFKGLENEVVILVDVTPPDRLKKEDSSHYIAMSRPRSLLSMIFTVMHSEQDHTNSPE